MRFKAIASNIFYKKNREFNNSEANIIKIIIWGYIPKDFF